MRGVGKLLLINFLVSASSSVVLHEEPLVLEGWNKLADEVHGSTTLKMRFALKLQNLDDLAKIAARVSDPQSSKYGQYLTASQIKELVAPKSEHRNAVEQWLSESSIPYEVVNGEVIEASITVEAAKALLKTNFTICYTWDTVSLRYMLGILSCQGKLKMLLQLCVACMVFLSPQRCWKLLQVPQM